MKVGDKLPGVFPTTFTPEEKGMAPIGKKSAFDRKIPVVARVEYIHPKGRFITVRFDFGGGFSFCESRRCDDVHRTVR